jgi:hypothetical protein
MLTHTGMLKTIQEHVRFARARFGLHCLTKIFLCRSPSSFSPWHPVTLP